MPARHKTVRQILLLRVTEWSYTSQMGVRELKALENVHCFKFFLILDSSGITARITTVL